MKKKKLSSSAVRLYLRFFFVRVIHGEEFSRWKTNAQSGGKPA